MSSSAKMPKPSSFFQRRIPTLLGLAILIIGVVAGLSLVQTDTGGFLPRASEDAVPKQVRITNITDTGFSVSFLTDIPAPSWVQYGTAANKTTTKVQDDRDQLANSASEFPTHHVTVRGLEPSTQYYFLIGTGSRSTFDNNGQAFSVRTARKETPAGAAQSAYGSVTNEVGNPVAGAIVYLTVAGAAPASALVQPNGSWAIPLATLRTADFSSIISLKPEDSVKVSVQGLKRGETIDLDSTVQGVTPLATLSFGRDNAAAAASPTPTPSPTPVTEASNEGAAQTSGFNTMVGDSQANNDAGAANKEVDIRLENNETVNTQRPAFNGTAPAGAYLQIEVHSENNYFDVVQVDGTGAWNWTSPADLEPGEHSVTLTYTDENGNQQKVTRTFLVQANTGSNLPAFTSSPSGKLATPTPTPITIVATPTPTPTPTPSPTPTPASRVTTPATSSAQPVSGGSTPTMMLVGISALFFVFGIVTTNFAFRRRIV